MKLLFVSPVSITIELENNEIYYSKEKYDVYLNNELVLKDINTNVFSLYDLTPNQDYSVKVNEEILNFKTQCVLNTLDLSKYKNVKKDVSKDIQKEIDNMGDNSLIIFPEGTYNITSISFKSNHTYYLKKGAILSASIDINDYEVLEPYEYLDNKKYLRGSWEGLPHKQRKSIIDIFNQENINIVGEGEINGNASKSIWWISEVRGEIARPHIIFIEESKNVYVEGISVCDSPQWTIHPYYSDNLGFYDLKITNPKISPNTDGLNPQSCKNVEIIGVNFSVGDDCISIKSGKKDLADERFKPAENTIIRNCLMNNGHGGVVLGSEISAGILNLYINRCLFVHTDRGLRIKTRRGRGRKGIIDNVEIDNIKMDNVLSPLTLNMFYFCDPDGKTEYVWSKEKLPVDDRTPYLGHFTFKNIYATDIEVCSGIFYGLPESPVGEIVIKDSFFSFKEKAIKDKPIMMSFAEEYSKKGFIFYNVDSVILDNVKMVGQDGEIFERINNPKLLIK